MNDEPQDITNDNLNSETGIYTFKYEVDKGTEENITIDVLASEKNNNLTVSFVDAEEDGESTDVLSTRKIEVYKVTTATAGEPETTTYTGEKNAEYKFTGVSEDDKVYFAVVPGAASNYMVKKVTVGEDDLDDTRKVPVTNLTDPDDPEDKVIVYSLDLEGVYENVEVVVSTGLDREKVNVATFQAGDGTDPDSFSILIDDKKLEEDEYLTEDGELTFKVNVDERYELEEDGVTATYSIKSLTNEGEVETTTEPLDGEDGV